MLKFISFQIIIGIFIWNSCAFSQNSGSSIDSRDGQRYNWVQIGSQIWMAENLNYNYGRGSGKYDNIYGRVYDWRTALRACPTGWHLPSDSEWIELEEYLGMNSEDLLSGGYRESGNVGLKLKSRTGWEFYIQPGNGYDNFGFNALPGGYFQSAINKFQWYGTALLLWTSTTANEIISNIELNEGPIIRQLSSHSNGIERDGVPEEHGCYCRCIKDKVY